MLDICQDDSLCQKSVSFSSEPITTTSSERTTTTTVAFEASATGCDTAGHTVVLEASGGGASTVPPFAFGGSHYYEAENDAERSEWETIERIDRPDSATVIVGDPVYADIVSEYSGNDSEDPGGSRSQVSAHEIGQFHDFGDPEKYVDRLIASHRNVVVNVEQSGAADDNSAPAERNSEIVEISAGNENVSPDEVSSVSAYTSFSDTLVTTPYFSPNEELNSSCFDSKTDQDVDKKDSFIVGMDPKSSTVPKDVQSPYASSVKDDFGVSDKELVKPNSFTLIKHKKVELSPTTFQSPKVGGEDKGV